MKQQILTISSLVGIFASLAGCVPYATISEQETVSAAHFDTRRVQRECRRLRCGEPNSVVTQVFIDLVRKNESGCVAYVLPKVGWGSVVVLGRLHKELGFPAKGGRYLYRQAS